jgi:hypothetical protein
VSTGGGPGGAGGADGGSGGTAGNPAGCDAPYSGPVGGPRSDGPAPILTSCETIEDEVILARYKDEAQKVPQGLYFERNVLISVWEQPCSESLEDTVARSNSFVSNVEEPLTSDWSYELSGCNDDSDVRRVYSNLRCDYFDGTQLAVEGAENLAFLASLLWWMDHGNLAGSQILGYGVTVGGASDLVHMCTIRTVFGDFGLCDEITLESTTHGILVGGQVGLGEPAVVRTLQGDCN